MLKILWSLGLTLTTTVQAARIPSMTPLVDHLRTLPAQVHGEVFLKSQVPIMDNNQARVSIRPNRNIFFGFDEDKVNVNLSDAINMCVKTSLDFVDGCLQVDLQRVSWTPEQGFKVELEMASYDIFGMYAAGTREALETSLNEKYNGKMSQAMTEVKILRHSKDIGEANDVARALGEVFSVSSGSGPAVDFGGRVSLSFQQPVVNPPPTPDVPIQIGDYRIGIEHGDRVTASLSFDRTGDALRIERFRLASSRGINLSQGTQYEQDMRIVFHELEVDADGTELAIHLGATETIQSLAGLIEVIAVAAGASPSRKCDLCEFAKLPAFTSEADLALRRAILNLVKEKQLDLLNYGVSQDTLDLFLRLEGCNVEALACQVPCYLSDTVQACMDNCAENFQMCRPP
jgi:hypothetical protein